jgi:Tol biopolymer transport system component
MRKVAVLILVSALTAAATVLLAACGSAPGASHCTANSDCTGDAVCEQNVCQQGYRLTASATGDGKGRVTSSPDGIDCPGNCSAVFPAGASVTLRSIPEASSDFMGWTGGCSGRGDCPLTMDAAKPVTALFRSNRVVFSSALKLDGTDASNGVFNLWRVDADGSGLKPLTRATAANANSLFARSSPDGRQIVFESNLKLDGSDAANPAANVWKIDADGTVLAPLTRATATTDGPLGMTPDWSHDGKQIAFASVRNVDGSDTPGPNKAGNVWRMIADGTGLTAVTTLTASGISSTTPQFSPDGAHIAFSSNRKLDGTDAVTSPGVSNLWRVNADGSGATPLTRTTAAADSALPQWSPDGGKIVFTSVRNVDLTDTVNPNNVDNIWRINADGTGLAPLTKGTAAGTSSLAPRWSPDGTRIVFVSSLRLDGSNAANTGNTQNLWIVNADGSGLAPLTRATASGDAGGIMFPQWSLEGSRILFSSALKLDGTDATNGPNSTLNLWRLDLNGNRLVPLTKGTASQATTLSCTTGNASLLPFVVGLAVAAWTKRRRRA